jgi:hypothetical protein
MVCDFLGTDKRALFVAGIDGGDGIGLDERPGEFVAGGH